MSYLEITEDEYVIIVHRGLDYLIYFDLNSYESWLTTGECNKCGDCLIGAVNPLLDSDIRKDIPMRFIKSDNCSLRCYHNGN